MNYGKMSLKASYMIQLSRSVTKVSVSPIGHNGVISLCEQQMKGVPMQFRTLCALFALAFMAACGGGTTNAVDKATASAPAASASSPAFETPPTPK